MKKTMRITLIAAFVSVAGYSVYTNQKTETMSDVVLDNVEALAGGETEYDQKIWERYYRPEGDGYNCIKGGSETC